MPGGGQTGHIFNWGLRMGRCLSATLMNEGWFLAKRTEAWENRYKSRKEENEKSKNRYGYRLIRKTKLIVLHVF